MNSLQQIAANNEWLKILPEIILGIWAMVLLLGDLLPKSLRPYLGSMTVGLVVGLLASLVGLLAFGRIGVEPHLCFNGLVLQDFRSEVFRCIFLALGVATLILAQDFLAFRRLAFREFQFLVLIATGALMLLAQANHFVMAFLALETVTITSYVMVGYNRRDSRSLEAGLKYLIYGGLSAACLLFGIVLLFGAASTPSFVEHVSHPLQFGELAKVVANPDYATHPLFMSGAILVLVGIGFKIGAFPFQVWVPDVYQGSPLPTTFFLATASKMGGFVLLMNLCSPGGGPFFGFSPWLVPVLCVLAAGSLLMGNLGAIHQRHTKRIIGLSGVSHAGFLLMGVAASFSQGFGEKAVIFYIVAYVLASIATFSVMASVKRDSDVDQAVDNYAELFRRQPLFGGILAAGIGSMAGIPPLAGFLAKLLIFIAAWKAGFYVLIAIAVACVPVSLFYYFGWLRAATVRQVELPGSSAEQANMFRAEASPAVKTLAVVAAVASVVLGIVPGLLMKF